MSFFGVSGLAQKPGKKKGKVQPKKDAPLPAVAIATTLNEKPKRCAAARRALENTFLEKPSPSKHFKVAR